MQEIRRYAAIDIGSNAVRLLVSNVIIQDDKEPLFQKSSMVRVPIRLGEESFNDKMISDNNKNRLVDAMKSFKLLMGIYGVEKFKACATSAMREAKNHIDIVAHVKKHSDIDIEVISGKKEAEIIASTDLKKHLKPGRNYLYVDVGGGSTEITLFSNDQLVNSKSFKIGTVRMLQNPKLKKEIFKEIKAWIKTNTANCSKITLIGSGGNINKIFKMSGQKINKPLTYSYLKSHFGYLKNLTYEERISELGLNPDRADVIIPATKIYLSAMKWSNAKKIIVPKIGLSDGIVKSLHYDKI